MLVSLQLVAPPGQAAAPGWQRSVWLSYRLEQDGRYSVEQTYEILLRTPVAARQAAQQSFGWSEGLESATLVEAATRKPDGTVLPVEADGVVEKAASATLEYPTFSDWRSRTIVFPDVRAGDTIRYVIRRTALQPLFPGAFEAAQSIGSLPYVREAEISVSAPAGLALNVATDNLKEAPPLAGDDGRVTRRWRLDPESHGGPVGIDLSTFPDYAALGSAYAARALPRAEPDATVRALAARLTEGLTEPRAKAKALYTYVATRIRYVALQFGAGHVVPRPAGEVLRDGYGDCKDHVALLQALLSAARIASEPALISTRPRYDLPDAPTLGLLDHVILHLPELDTWLDPTSYYASFGVLPVNEYGKPVVLVGPEGARLAQVPLLSREQNWTRLRTELEIAADGTLSGRTEMAAGGPSAVSLRETADGLENQSPVSQLRWLGTPGTGSYSFASPLALEGGDYRVEAGFRLEDRLADYQDGRIAPPVGLSVIARPGSSLVGQEVTGGRVCHAGQQEEEIRLRLPATVRPEALPRDLALSGGPARYTVSWRQEGEAVVVRRRFTLDAPGPLCSAAEYEAMRPVLRAIRLELRTQLALSTGPTMAGTDDAAGPAGTEDAAANPPLRISAGERAAPGNAVLNATALQH